MNFVEAIQALNDKRCRAVKSKIAGRTIEIDPFQTDHIRVPLHIHTFKTFLADDWEMVDPTN